MIGDYIKDRILRIYFSIYMFVSKVRLEKKDTAERFIHTHLVSVLSTGILMWGYAILAYFTIDHPAPTYIGFISSIIHLLSPLMYRFSNNHLLNSSVFIGSGLCHQLAFAFYTGGFDSNIIIWLGILPMLAGVISGRVGTIIWSILTSLFVLTLFILKLNGFEAPNLISENGRIISQAMIAFGWIFISTVVIWVYVLLDEIHSEELEVKNQSIQNLVFILAHDISNHLMVVISRIILAQRRIGFNSDKSKIELPLTEKENIDRVLKAARSIEAIVENVKDLYSTELGKKEIPIESIELQEVLDEIKENFHDKLAYKNIDLQIRSPLEKVFFDCNRSLLIHQILGNLISNAIKFSKESDKIALIGESESSLVKICISDNGIGIPKSIREKLFDLHSHTSRKGTLGEVGTGFGLPIVKVYVEKLGGKISFESKTVEDNTSNTGTKFIITFPRELKNEEEKLF